MRAVYARDEYGVSAIRGKVAAVNLHVVVDGHTLRALDIHPRDWPAQPNNASEWYRRAVKFCGDRRIILIQRTWNVDEGEGFDFILNDGEGVKQGRGSNDNKFTFRLRPSKPVDGVLKEARLDLYFRSIAYQQIAAEKARKEGRVWGMDIKGRVIEGTPGQGGFFMEDDD